MRVTNKVSHLVSLKPGNAFYELFWQKLFVQMRNTHNIHKKNNEDKKKHRKNRANIWCVRFRVVWLVQFIIYRFVKVVRVFVLHSRLTSAAICFCFFWPSSVFFSLCSQQNAQCACGVIIFFIWCISFSRSKRVDETNTKRYLYCRTVQYLCHCINWHQQIEQ